MRQREEWRYAIEENGEQCVAISGQKTTLQSSAGTWASVMLLEVSAKYIAIGLKQYNIFLVP